LHKQIAIPQDHGSWVFILSPLVVGIFAGRVFHQGTVMIVVAAMAAFLMRQPLTTVVKVYSGRRPRTDLPAALFWTALYALIGIIAVAGLILSGNGYVTYLAVPGIPVFAWHLWLVSRRAERRQRFVEIVATGVLSLAAPGAYWVGLQHYDPAGWWLWLLTWLQSGASILHAYMRLEQRVLREMPERTTQWRMARGAIAATSFNMLFTLALGVPSLLPRFLFLAYIVQWLETLWCAFHPAVRMKPVLIGVRQTIISVLWTVLFIVFWLNGWMIA
jgi:hypothetical protein